MMWDLLTYAEKVFSQLNNNVRKCYNLIKLHVWDWKYE